MCFHYQIDVTELIQPEIVDGSGDCGKIVGLESAITQCYCCAQTRQNPAIRDTFTATQLKKKKPTQTCSKMNWGCSRTEQSDVVFTVSMPITSSCLTWAFSLGTNPSPRVLMANFTAFHSLLQKCLYPRILLTSRLMSRPGRNENKR